MDVLPRRWWMRARVLLLVLQCELFKYQCQCFYRCGYARMLQHLCFYGNARNISWSVVFSRTLASTGKELKDNFLKALAEREEANRSGKSTSVIFIRDSNTLGQEVSGYIDYAQRLKTQDFEPYFSRKKKLMPGPSDLCYYNWKTQVSTSNSSTNFQVIYDDPNGILFQHKKDKKILNVDPLTGASSTQTGKMTADRDGFILSLVFLFAGGYGCSWWG
uniref:Cilia- and flagella-associated protein 299 n=1 Tax=Nothobranchius furzeri TaxID=105023 RepID=A0A8C6P2D7_NOTFU